MYIYVVLGVYVSIYPHVYISIYLWTTHIHTFSRSSFARCSLRSCVCSLAYCCRLHKLSISRTDSWRQTVRSGEAAWWCGTRNITLQRTATHCNTLQGGVSPAETRLPTHTLQHTATHCHTLPHTRRRHDVYLILHFPLRPCNETFTCAHSFCHSSLKSFIKLLRKFVEQSNRTEGAGSINRC